MHKGETVAVLAIIFFWLLLGAVTISSWLTHVVTTIQNEQWLLLLAGGLIAPIGVIHGIMIWFGWA